MQINYAGSGNSSLFTYDGADRCVRIIESVGGGTTNTRQFVWCGERMCEARDASGDLINQYFPHGQTISESNYFYTKDHLGSVRELSDSSGNPEAQYSYDPYGRITQLRGGQASDFQYAGYFQHAPSALNLTVFRAYSPILSRWINRDPIQEAGGINLYEYVSSEPLNSNDTDGLSGWLTICSCRTGKPLNLIPFVGKHTWVQYLQDGSSGPPQNLGTSYGAGLDTSQPHSTPTETRSGYLDDNQEQSLFNYLNNTASKGRRAWRPWRSCARFACRCWKVSTGENLGNPNTPVGASNAINNANSGMSSGVLGQ